MNTTINHTTRFFNGTRDGSPYQAQITKVGERDTVPTYEVNVVIFDRESGEAHYSFERQITTYLKARRAVQAVIANPDHF